jgi:glucosamine--fructose-6-phosphate aminotransferase (isomerizing)
MIHRASRRWIKTASRACAPKESWSISTTKLKNSPLAGTVGIGHTRWATHGLPNEKNAHPHASEHVAVVHNGIIENYAELKEELEQSQARFETDTDTEVIVHLVTHYLKQGMQPQEAANAAFG